MIEEPRVGQRVRVVALANAEGRGEGVVAEVVHSHGCGEVAGDPMVVVRFDFGDRDGFWREELEEL